jgi:hypothetical protein
MHAFIKANTLTVITSLMEDLDILKIVNRYAIVSLLSMARGHEVSE